MSDAGGRAPGSGAPKGRASLEANGSGRDGERVAGSSWITSDLATRAATAGVLVPALLLAVFVDPTPWSVVGLACLVAVLAQDEYLRMALPVSAEDPVWSVRFVSAGLGVGLVLLSSAVSPAPVLAPILSFSAVLLGVVTLVRGGKHLAHAGRHFAVSLSGLLYVPLLISVLPLLKRVDGGQWLAVTLCMAFFSDTVAYLFGHAFGRHKLYPAVSPGKTWEGSVGGILGSCLATLGLGSAWLVPALPIGHALVLGVVGSMCGQTGDLVESMLKRTFGVKDSGNLLPGHGGMLDRVDALIFVAPVSYYYVAFVTAWSV